MKNKQPKDLNMPTKGFARPAQVAFTLGVSKSTVYNMVADGRLPQPIRNKYSPRTTLFIAEDIWGIVDTMIAAHKADQDNQPKLAS